MYIEETDIYKLNYFTYKKAFTGSYGNMRYRIIRMEKEETGEAVLSVAVYPQPYCWEETDEDKKQIREFEFSDEGRLQMIAWLNQKIEEFKEG